MLRNAAYINLYRVGTPKDICNMVISYIPNHEYIYVVNEFTVLMHYYRYSNKKLYKVIPIILKHFRKSKMYRMAL
jgi:hypothetical protein